jgi:hypothetical protein
MKAFLMATTALLVSVPVAAQQPGHAAHAGQVEGASMMAKCMEKMGGPAPAMLLHHRAELQLTAEQVTRLEAMQQQMKAQKQEHRGEHGQHAHHGEQAKQGPRAHHGQRAEHAQHADRAQHAHGGQEAHQCPHCQHGQHEQHAAMAAEAAALLTDAQRERLADFVRKPSKHEHGASGGHAADAAGSHAGMAGCPMKAGAAERRDP